MTFMPMGFTTRLLKREDSPAKWSVGFRKVFFCHQFYYGDYYPIRQTRVTKLSYGAHNGTHKNSTQCYWSNRDLQDKVGDCEISVKLILR